ncbi:MAG: hypothetical protein IPG91_24075 [Ideonella sp.]|nr:hypothetical protein [Ideonella sp.]
MGTALPQDVREATDTSAVTTGADRTRMPRPRSLGAHAQCFHPDSIVRLGWFSGTGRTSSGARSTWRAAACCPRTGSDRWACAERRARGVVNLAATIDIRARWVVWTSSCQPCTLHAAPSAATAAGAWPIQAFYLRDGLHPQRRDGPFR